MMFFTAKCSFFLTNDLNLQQFNELNIIKHQDKK